jgi:hypothetical protein
MRTSYVFQAANSPDLRGYTYDPAGERLPAQCGPWTPIDARSWPRRSFLRKTTAPALSAPWS